MKEKLAVVIPVYGHFDYAANAVASLFANTHSVDPYVIVVDDASPEAKGKEDLGPIHEVIRQLPPMSAHVIYFGVNGGLTRSWNAGLNIARSFNHPYCCVTNSDVLFTPGWELPLIDAIKHNYMHLVGPITNAPGTEKKQNVANYVPGYEVKDDPEYLNAIAKSLFFDFGDHAVDSTINGFCMLARTKTWWEHAYDKDNVFRPRNDFNSKGERNPTPLMTLNEYELQSRWHKAGLRTGYCPGSFVFHYRAVSRGEAHKKPGWYRMAP